MFAFLFAQVIAASSPTSGWWYVGDMGRKPDRTIFYVSLDTRQADGDIARVWTWAIDETLSDSGRESIKTYWENRCKTGEQRSLMIVGYDRNGATTGSVNQPSAWSYVIPDSNGAKFFEVACHGKTQMMIPIYKPQATPAEVARELFQED